MTAADGVTNGGWLKRNIPAVVAWALIVITAAAAFGATSATIGRVEDDVLELKQLSKTAIDERAVLRGDVRVGEQKHAALSARVDRFERVAERLEKAVRMLEAVGNRIDRAAP